MDGCASLLSGYKDRAITRTESRSKLVHGASTITIPHIEQVIQRSTRCTRVRPPPLPLSRIHSTSRGRGATTTKASGPTITPRGLEAIDNLKRSLPVLTALVQTECPAWTERSGCTCDNDHLSGRLPTGGERRTKEANEEKETERLESNRSQHGKISHRSRAASARRHLGSLRLSARSPRAESPSYRDDLCDPEATWRATAGELILKKKAQHGDREQNSPVGPKGKPSATPSIRGGELTRKVSRMHSLNSISAMAGTTHNVTQSVYATLCHDEARTEIQVEKLLHAVEGVKFFDEQSESVRKDLCHVMKFETCPANGVVFHQGEQGAKYYVIVAGSVSVVIDFGGGIVKCVDVQTEGDAFGELALMNDAPRAASIIALEPCEFLVIEKEDYLRTVQMSRHKDLRHKVEFLSRLEPFRNLSRAKLQKLAYVTYSRLFGPNQVIVKEGELADHIYFVVKGECIKVKALRCENSIRHVKFETLRIGDMFGEKAMYDNTTRECSVVSESSAQVFSINSMDVKKVVDRRCLNVFQRLVSELPTVQEIRKGLAATTKWESFKRGVVEEVLARKAAQTSTYYLRT